MTVPISCLAGSSNIAAYSVFNVFRSLAMLIWLWSMLARFDRLAFDNDYKTAMNFNVRGAHMNEQIYNNIIEYKTHVSCLKRSLLLSIYFIIAFIVLSFLYIFNVHNNSALTWNEIASVLFVLPPYGYTMFWVPHSIWDIQESWQIRDELVYIFIVTSS